MPSLKVIYSWLLVTLCLLTITMGFPTPKEEGKEIASTAQNDDKTSNVSPKNDTEKPSELGAAKNVANDKDTKSLAGTQDKENTVSEKATSEEKKLSEPSSNQNGPKETKEAQKETEVKTSKDDKTEVKASKDEKNEVKSSKDDKNEVKSSKDEKNEVKTSKDDKSEVKSEEKKSKIEKKHQISSQEDLFHQLYQPFNIVGAEDTPAAFLSISGLKIENGKILSSNVDVFKGA